MAVLSACALYPLAVWQFTGRALSRLTIALDARKPV